MRTRRKAQITKVMKRAVANIAARLLFMVFPLLGWESMEYALVGKGSVAVEDGALVFVASIVVSELVPAILVANIDVVVLVVVGSPTLAVAEVEVLEGSAVTDAAVSTVENGARLSVSGLVSRVDRSDC